MFTTICKFSYTGSWTSLKSRLVILVLHQYYIDFLTILIGEEAEFFSTAKELKSDRIDFIKDGYFSKLIEKESTANFLKYVLDIQSALIHIPSIKLNDERVNLIKNGMKVSLVNEFGKVSLDNIYTAALEKPLALGYLKSGFFYPRRVFN